MLFERYCAPTLKYLNKTVKAVVPLAEINLVQTLLSMLRCLLRDPDKFSRETIAECEKALEPAFVFASIWSFGSGISEKDGEDYRKAFQTTGDLRGKMYEFQHERRFSITT